MVQAIANFKELKDYLNTRSDEELAAIPLGVQRTDDFYHDISGIWVLDEDYYQSDYGMEPVSTWEEENDEKFEEFGYTIYPKGFILFDSD
jgi:hypothetical protein